MKIAKKSLTVIILTYNSSDTIRPCMDSLVAQTANVFKVIIVDDASTDDTLSIIKSYGKRLEIVVKNTGAHNISTSRNIGLEAVTTPYAAFIDSDAYADEKWVENIITFFDDNQDTVLLAGRVINEYSTDTAKAIAINDETIRDLFWKGELLLQGCNFALNYGVLGGLKFDEDFVHAEDLDYTWKVQQAHKWQYVDTIVVHHQSRGSLRRYYNQMYKYSIWKLYFEYRTGHISWIDFVPMTIFIVSVAIAIATGLLWALLLYPAFCAAEAVFIVIYRRPAPKYIPRVFAAWFIKNTAWSLGAIKGLYKLLADSQLRDMVNGKSRVKT